VKYIVAIFAALITLLGIFLGSLPDAFPQEAMSIPPFHYYDAGLKQLLQMDLKDSNGKPFGRLRPESVGYDRIYDTLRNIDPTIPAPAEADPSSPNAPTILLVTGPQTISYSGGKLPLFKPVLINTADGKLVPVCMLSELTASIHSSLVRFWTKIGLYLTAASSIVATVLSLCGSRKLPKDS